MCPRLQVLTYLGKFKVEFQVFDFCSIRIIKDLDCF